MKKIIIILLIILLMFSGCSFNNQPDENIDEISQDETKDLPSENKEDDEQALNIDEDENENIDNNEDNIDEEEKQPIEVENKEEINLEEVKPNELGQVMIIMYHTLGKTEGDYISTPKKFREVLNKLKELKYKPVSLTDYINGEIDIEAGYTPFVITFDDGHISNFKIIEENDELKIDPNCAVGVMDDFAKQNPNFGKSATFFINGYTPFGQAEYLDYKFEYLVKEGYEIGNHTYDHSRLDQISANEIEIAIGKNVALVQEYLPNYQVKYLALPFGIKAKGDGYGKMLEGTYNDVSYKNEAILKVGWRPEYSVFNNKFDFTSINRVQSGPNDFQLDYWIEYFEDNPDKRYISDGNSEKITFPEENKVNLNEEMINGKEIVTY